MSLEIKYNPSNYSSAHEDCFFVLLEDTKPFNSTTYPDYKYICDIWIDNVLQARLKSFPRSNDKLGVFNIGNVIRNYLETTFAPTAPSNGSVRSQKFGEGEFYVNVTCKFGEEYGFTTYVNLLIDSQRTYFNHYNGRQYGTTTILTNYVDKVLSTRPYQTNVDRNATYCFLPFHTSDDSSYDVEVRCYNNSLGLINTATFNFTPTATSVNEVQQLNVAPQNINATTPGTITGIVDYYTVTLNTPNDSNDSVYRFNLTCEHIHEVQTIHFMNQFGCFESKEFTKVSRKSINIERESFGQAQYRISSAGIVTFSNSNVYYEQSPIYAVTYGEKMQINTDIINDQEYVWLGQLIKSPVVFCQLNGYFYQVKINETNYDERKVINDKLTNLTLNIEFGERFNTQYR